VGIHKNPHRYLSSSAKFTRSHAVPWWRLNYFQATAFLIYLRKCLGKQLIFTRLWKLVVRAVVSFLILERAPSERCAREFLSFSCGAPTHRDDRPVKDSDGAAGKGGGRLFLFHICADTCVKSIMLSLTPASECYLNWRDTQEINIQRNALAALLFSIAPHSHTAPRACALCARRQPAAAPAAGRQPTRTSAPRIGAGCVRRAKSHVDTLPRCKQLVTASAL